MSLLADLRHCTSPQHRRLDSSLSAETICGSEAALADYLEHFHQALSLCWLALDWTSLEQLGLDRPEARRNRYHALRLDLSDWERPVPALETSPGAAGTAGARSVGVLYVLEGSVHGSRMLLKQAETGLGPLPPARRRFLDGFGPGTPALWSAFVGWLDTLPADPGFRSEACASACWAFRIFTEALVEAPGREPKSRQT